MSSINPEDIFYKNPEFEIETRHRAVYLRNRFSGGLVEIDEIGKKILFCLPAGLNSIRKKLKTKQKLVISSRLLSYYLLVFWKGRIIEKKGKRKSTGSGVRGTADGKIRISVVIVTHNGEKFISDNLKAIRNQTVMPEEIIVVDNNSSDLTVNLAIRFGKRITLIRNRKNLHYARGVNIGVEHSSGDMILILNQDVVLDRHFLAEVTKSYQKRNDQQDIAAVVPQMRFMKLKGFVNSFGNVIRNRGWGSDNYFGAVDIGQLKNIRTVKSTCFGCVVVTREGWNRVGKLDERYVSYYEDVDWSFRAHLKRMNLITAPDAIVYHHFGGSYDPGLRLKLVTKNRLRFVLKNFSGRIMLGFLKNYMLEDWRNSLALVKGKRVGEAACYPVSYLKIVMSVPGFIRHHLQKKSASRPQIEQFFSQSPGPVILTNQALQPVINKDVIRSYYYFTEPDV